MTSASTYQSLGLSLDLVITRPIPNDRPKADKLAGISATDVTTWPDHATAVLAGHGYQRGGARSRIIELLAGQPCALTALEIEDALRAQGTPIGRASVYRVLELLVEPVSSSASTWVVVRPASRRSIPAASTTTTSYASAADAWSRSMTPHWSVRSEGSRNASGCRSTTTTYCCAAPASAAAERRYAVTLRV